MPKGWASASYTLHTYNVILTPDKFIRGQAPAGIQQKNQFAKRTRAGFCPAMQELFNQLDSRLRGNDGKES